MMLSMRIKLLFPLSLSILSGLLVGGVGGVWLFDQPQTRAVETPWAKFKARGNLRTDILAGPKMFSVGSGVVVTPQKKGVEVRSKFDVDNPRSGTDGAAYHFIHDQKKVLGSAKKATVAVDVSLYDIYPGNSKHTVSFQYVQNGRRASGWRSFPVKSGRHIYHFSFEPAPANAEKKVDSFWIRSDALGENRPVTVYSVRVYEE